MRFRSQYLTATNHGLGFVLNPVSVSLGHVVLTSLALLVEGSSPTRNSPTVHAPLSADGSHEFTSSPEQSTSLFSQLSYAWVVPMILLARTKVLTKADLWNIPAAIGSQRNGDKLKSEWMVELRGNKPSFIVAFIKAFLPSYLPLLLATTLTTCVGFLRPAFIGFFVTFVSTRGTDKAVPMSDGLVMASVFLFLNVLQLVLDHNVGFRVSKLNLSIQSAVRMLVYEKMLRLPSHRQTSVALGDNDNGDNATNQQEATDSTDLGKIVTVIDSDTDQLVTPLGWSMEMFSSPIIFVVAIALLYGQVGWLCVLPPVIIIGSSPVLSRISGRMAHHTKCTQEHAGKRTKLLSDTVGHMLGFKLYGWVQVMAKRILAEREKEIESRRRGLRIYSFQLGLSEAVPALSTFAVFVAYAFVAAPGELTVAKVFTTLSIIGMLDHPITGLMYGWYPYVEAYASSGRISKFLLSEERVDYVQRFPPTHHVETQPLLIDVHGGATPSPAPWAVRINNAKFSFTNSADRLALTVPSLSIARGSHTAVIGSVGDGKSALLAAILGEIDCLTGTVSVRCTNVAYVGQHPWVFHASVQDNIRFGLPLDKVKYDQTIDACALRSDLDGFPMGDQQLIGDKGRQLSGGQKARLALARAMYAVLMGGADLVLLDDPLSSVDAHVERHIFDRLFAPETGLLTGTTVVMVTNGLHHLSALDSVVLVRQGEIVESGLFQSVVANEDGHVRQLVDKYMANRKFSASSAGRKQQLLANEDDLTAASERGTEDNKSTTSSTADVSSTSAEGEQEDVQSGSVNLGVYKAYLAHCGIGFFTVLVLLEALCQASRIFVTIWLGFWSSSVDNPDFSMSAFAGIYTLIVAASILLAIVTAYFGLATVGLRAAKTTQTQMLHAVFAAPMSFFNSTSAGHILQRFTNDQRMIDVRMPHNLHSLLSQVFGLVGTVLTIAVATPWFLLVVVPSPFLFKFVQAVYLAASVEVERISAVLKSPVLQHLSESAEGIVTVRGCGHTGRFVHDATVKFDHGAVADYNSEALSGWRNLAQQLISTSLISGLAFLIVLTPTADATLVGVALLHSSNILWQLSSTFNYMSEIENTMVSLERINAYTHLEPETNPPGALKFAHDEWPATGEIQFGGFSTRYAQGAPLVLDSINLKIAGGSKVAIVGRTGSGKTSTALSLFRILEAASGSIQIDGVDIAQVDLETLRSRLTILPQDPTIFTATVRENLDPLGIYADADLWRALDQSTLASHVRTLGAAGDSGAGGLDAELTPTSLSAGQAQLLALSRAMLRKSKILVCDEATAKLDSASDAVVQRAIREQFAGQTVVTIAHRIDTVMDYDVVVVLSDGQVVEVGKPTDLCRGEKSLFAGLARQSGLVA
ncbi:P-loop containing nucleoside triphosphate hydrolase protein [Catenaria anguillulae PL171]|uniref:p-loop containing nucleoside triphosphate hydrolase protein n=1 Tax=Catenaria anguillulae PL171 TaxID=765915 RepID=A0A1Y2HEE4_9FUNG|nr:P-loop containing nucleoside triphosphate hydrolase protein [Catenaria anguillulae PL171]